MVTMKLKALIGLLLEIGMYNVEIRKKHENTLRFKALQKNIGMFIREIRTGAGMPSTWEKNLQKLQDWHRTELATFLAHDYKDKIDKSDNNENISQYYQEIYSLLKGCKRDSSVLFQDAQKSLYELNFIHSAKNYMPSAWPAIVSAEVYSILPDYSSWCVRCERTKFYELAESLFPQLKQPKENHIESNTETESAGSVEVEYSVLDAL